MNAELTGSTRPSQAQGENLHGHSALALAAVDVGVGCEDVRPGLRGVRLEGHFDLGMRNEWNWMQRDLSESE